MKVEQVTQFDPLLLDEVNRLLPQLSSSARLLSELELRAILDSDATYLLTAGDAQRLYGMLTVVVFRIPTGARSWVEDVVVDEVHRGNGVGGRLLEAAIVLARQQGAKTLDLTSRPAREAANRLYQKVGFIRRETNVYRISL